MVVIIGLYGVDFVRLVETMGIVGGGVLVVVRTGAEEHAMKDPG